MTQVEKQFNEDMRTIYQKARSELNYTASRFWQLFLDKGGVEAAKILIAKDGGADGFRILWENKKLDLTVEAHVVKPEYTDLFTEEERALCRDRLKRAGFITEKIS